MNLLRYYSCFTEILVKSFTLGISKTFFSEKIGTYTYKLKLKKKFLLFISHNLTKYFVLKKNYIFPVLVFKVIAYLQI